MIHCSDSTPRLGAQVVPCAGERRAWWRRHRRLVVPCWALFVGLVLVLSQSQPGAAQAEPPGPELVKDINQQGPGSGVSSPLVVNNTLFFAANNHHSGYELWKSDGTVAGTQLVKDIWPGAASSYPSSLTNVNGTLYFTADGGNGVELWKSDGSAAGTQLVKDIQPGGPSSYPSSLTNVNGTLYFAATDGSNGWELWKSNGTPAGTVLVKDIAPGGLDALPASLVNINGVLYFTADDGVTGREVWKSDGTAAGTSLLKDIAASNVTWTAESLTNMNGVLFFMANGGLWKSDGTTANTVLVKEVPPGCPAIIESVYPALTPINGTLFFVTSAGSTGCELWKSDGTMAGTGLVKDLVSGASGSFPAHLVNVNGTLYFAAQAGAGRGLWKSDGTTTGTVLVKGGINPASSVRAWPSIGSSFYFVAESSQSGGELWQSDGTMAGTLLLKDIAPGVASGVYDLPVSLGGMLYFAADDGNGKELWRSDGSTAGTILFKDLNPVTAGSPIWSLLKVGEMLYLQVGQTWWKSDGSEAGTTPAWAGLPVSDLNPSAPVMVNGLLYFTAADATRGRELWKSDGTVAGTVWVKDIYPGSTGSEPQHLTSVGNTLYFVANDGNGGLDLWKSDGSEAGTVQVRDFNAALASLMTVNGTLFFTVDGRLWKSNGTEAGTVLVKNLPLYLGIAPVNANGTLYFIADDGVSGWELWKSDGSEAGTVLVKDIGIGGNEAQILDLTPVGDLLYFSANDGQRGRELWRSDGTQAGTRLVKDISFGLGDALPSDPFTDNLRAGEGLVFFWANDPVHSLGLWRSDGTEAGTIRLKDSNGSGILFPMVKANGVVFFSEADEQGSELWKSDGTQAGTMRLWDLAPGAGSSNPDRLTVVGNTLFFTADDGLHGTELWKLALLPSYLACVDPSFVGQPTGALVDGAGCGLGQLTVGSGAFGTLQAGAEALAAGGTVIVAGGSYNESLTLDDFVTVRLAGPLDLNGNLSLNGGSLDVSPANHPINLSGNWTAAGGRFYPQHGTVNLDGAAQTLTGSTHFFNLSKQSQAVETLTFQAGSTQTVWGTLSWQGAPAALLRLRSSQPGTPWLLSVPGKRRLTLLDVQDSQNLSPASLWASQSQNSGNNQHWQFAEAPCRDFALPTGIGVEDLQAIASHWPQTSQTPGQDLLFDLESDGVVAVTDLLRLSRQWGLSCP
jgi:ELWxxDGT repeat protein